MGGRPVLCSSCLGGCSGLLEIDLWCVTVMSKWVASWCGRCSLEGLHREESACLCYLIYLAFSFAGMSQMKEFGNLLLLGSSFKSFRKALVPSSRSFPPSALRCGWPCSAKEAFYWVQDFFFWTVFSWLADFVCVCVCVFGEVSILLATR